ATVGVLAGLSAAWVWLAMPDGVRPAAMSGDAWRRTLQSPALILTVGVTLCSSAGQFTLMAYLAPYFKQVLDASPKDLSLAFLWFGVFALVGNLLMSRFIESVGSARGVLISQGVMALAFALWPLGQSWPLALAVLAPWALGCFAANSAQQARLVGIAPSLASGSVALNSAAMYAGQAIGAAIGGAMVAVGQIDQLHAAGLVGLLLSIGCSMWASRQRPPAT
ncbi:MAG: MFS transporter, partial [Betaproteobacteria bacterium]|nr:MFS transporter [Betaproteobacteria bacterium]